MKSMKIKLRFFLMLTAVALLLNLAVLPCKSQAVTITDIYPFSTALMEIDTFGVGVDTINLNGSTTINRYLHTIGDPDSNGRESIQTEIVSMNLTGASPTYGTITFGLSTLPSLGMDEETTNTTPGVLDVGGGVDSFFDVFFNVNTLALGVTLHNVDPLHLHATITPGLPVIYDMTTAPIELLDDTGKPIGSYVRSFRFLPGTAAPIPEPSTLLLLGSGLAGLGYVRRRFK